MNALIGRGGYTTDVLSVSATIERLDSRRGELQYHPDPMRDSVRLVLGRGLTIALACLLALAGGASLVRSSDATSAPIGRYPLQTRGS